MLKFTILSDSKVADNLVPTCDIASAIKRYDDKAPKFLNHFSFRMVEPVEIVKIVSSISTNAIGVDDISAKHVKLMLEFLAQPLAHIVNYCIEKSYFPAIWKQSLIKQEKGKTKEKKLMRLKVMNLKKQK